MDVRNLLYFLKYSDEINITVNNTIYLGTYNLLLLENLQGKLARPERY
jgi:hypothetical protein